MISHVAALNTKKEQKSSKFPEESSMVSTYIKDVRTDGKREKKNAKYRGNVMSVGCCNLFDFR